MSTLFCKFHLFGEKNNQLLQSASLTYLYLKSLSFSCLLVKCQRVATYISLLYCNDISYSIKFICMKNMMISIQSSMMTSLICAPYFNSVLITSIRFEFYFCYFIFVSNNWNRSWILTLTTSKANNQSNKY